MSAAVGRRGREKEEEKWDGAAALMRELCLLAAHCVASGYVFEGKGCPRVVEG